MRFAVALIIVTIMACAALASHQRKPFAMRIDAKPAAWPTNAAANRVEMIDSYSCMRLVVPFQVTTEKPKGVTQT